MNHPLTVIILGAYILFAGLSESTVMAQSIKGKTIFNSNDFDPNVEVIRLLPAIDDGGLPLVFRAEQNLSVHCGNVSFTNISGAITIDGEQTGLSDFELKKTTVKDFGTGKRYVSEYVNRKRGVSWIWTAFVRKNDVLLMASVKNNSKTVITIKDLELLRCEKKNGAEIFEPHSGKTTFFKWNTWDMGVQHVENNTARYVSDNILHLYDPETNLTALIGFLTMSRMKTSHSMQVSAGEGIVQCVVGLNFGEYELRPGQTFNSELCRISFHDDPYVALELWADNIRNIYQPKIEGLPPVGLVTGWLPVPAILGGESWESAIMGCAKATRERLRGFDVDYIWTSQTNLKDYIPGNWLHENRDEIPSGLKQFFANQLALGFKPGLWASPFWFYAEAEGMLKEHEGHLLRDKDGNPISNEQVWGWRYNHDDSPWYHMHQYFLDGSHPDAIAYIKKLFSYYHEIGVRYYMLDFLDIVNNSVLYDKTKTPFQAGYAILKEIREVSGADTHIQTAVASSPGFTGTINAARIGRDFGEGRPIDGHLADWRNASHVRHDMHYANIRFFIQNIAGNYFTHGKIYMNDFNEMTVDKPYPVDHAQVVATAFGLGGSPLMMGDDIRTISDERLRYVKMCLPRTLHAAKPVDLFDRVLPDDYSRIMKLSIDTQWDSYMLVAVYNCDEKPYELMLDFEKLRLDKTEKYVVYDFWNEEYCGVFKESYPVMLLPESCKLYRIAKKRDYPWLLSTDMHIQQGYCEIVDVHWDMDNRRLSLSATRPVGEQGNLYVLMPRNYQLKNPQTHGVHLLKELLDYKVVMQIPVTFNKEIESFTFDFEEFYPSPLSPRGHLPYSTEKDWPEYLRKNYRRQETRIFE